MQASAPGSGKITRLEVPATDESGEALDLIMIEGFTGQTVIGIHESELHRPQPLVIDLEAGLRRNRAGATDQIADTIDYGVVSERLRLLMQSHGVQLLEALAEKIAAMLIDDFRAAWVRVRIVKPRKFADVEAVGVQIERRAPITAPPGASEANAGAPKGAQVLQWIGAAMVPRGGGER